MLKIILFIIFTIYVYSENLFTKEELEYIKQKKTILVSNEYDYEPYDFMKQGKTQGYSIDLLNLLLKDTGLKIQYITKPWNDLVNDLNTKKIDLLHTIYKTPQREKFYTYSAGYSKTIQSYIIRKNDKNINNITELFGKKVGVSRGWAEEKFFNKYSQIKKVYYDSIQDKLNALTMGEIDAFTNSANVANYYIYKYGYNTLKV
jgi:ABC-type amino acid transport substrate-binding protein